jgi:hypothetical protein
MKPRLLDTASKAPFHHDATTDVSASRKVHFSGCPRELETPGSDGAGLADQPRTCPDLHRSRQRELLGHVLGIAGSEVTVEPGVPAPRRPLPGRRAEPQAL